MFRYFGDISVLRWQLRWTNGRNIPILCNFPIIRWPLRAGSRYKRGRARSPFLFHTKNIEKKMRYTPRVLSLIYILYEILPLVYILRLREHYQTLKILQADKFVRVHRTVTDDMEEVPVDIRLYTIRPYTHQSICRRDAQ